MSSAFGTETVLDVRHWTDSYFSFTTTRDDGFRFENGQFVMIGLQVEGKPLLFSGDTLFPGGPGNTNFGGDFLTIITSIEERLFSPLAADTLVMPGHGDDTTIGAEAPQLQEWIDRGW